MKLAIAALFFLTALVLFGCASSEIKQQGTTIPKGCNEVTISRESGPARAVECEVR